MADSDRGDEDGQEDPRKGLTYALVKMRRLTTYCRPTTVTNHGRRARCQRRPAAGRSRPLGAGTAGRDRVNVHQLRVDRRQPGRDQRSPCSIPAPAARSRRRPPAALSIPSNNATEQLKMRLDGTAHTRTCFTDNYRRTLSLPKGPQSAKSRRCVDAQNAVININLL